MWFPKSKHGKYKTCSDKCKLEKEFNQKDIRTKPCVTCGKLFTPRNIQLKLGHGNYCSQACNTSSHEAMNEVDAQIKAKERRAETLKIRGQVLRGKDHHSWKGGKAASWERREEYRKKYYEENKYKWRVSNINRRASGIGKLSLDIIQKLVNLQSNQCAICLEDLERYHVDHIIPICRGGMNIDSNVQLTCVSCNLKKGHWLISELNDL